MRSGEDPPSFVSTVLAPAFFLSACLMAGRALFLFLEGMAVSLSILEIAATFVLSFIVTLTIWLVRVHKLKSPAGTISGADLQPLSVDPKLYTDGLNLIKSGSRAKGSVEMTGLWQGSYRFESGHDDQVPSFSFTMELTHTADGGFEGVSKDHDFGKYYGLITVRGRTAGKKISFIKEYRGLPWRFFEKPVLYIGDYDAELSQFRGTWKKGTWHGLWSMKR